jgi:hypothetical protein
MRWVLVGAVILGGILFMYTSISLPHFGPQQSARVRIAELQTIGIHKALMMYATDHEGRFPEGFANSNEAYRKLFPEYLEEEKHFYVPPSAWHAAAPDHKTDNDIGTPPTYEKALQRGENHWTYVSGLGAKSDAHLPLIADGFVEGSPGTYTNDPPKKGGVWKGAKAIVVFVSGSAEAIPLSPKSGFRVLRTDPVSGAQTDLFQLPIPPPGSVRTKILNPE